MTRFVLYAAAVTFVVCSAPIWSGSALADRRLALVIGNSTYQLAPTIPNPTRDAQAIAAEFTKAGFDVVSAHYDQGNLQFKRAIRQFEDAAADADIAVVFYAGHGIEIGGVNYMIPVDAKLASDRDAKDEAIELDRLLEAVDAAKRLGLVILDACRDNPFERTMKRQRVSALRAVNTGLALIEPTNRNVLIAYASKSGTTAEDGDAEHSPFTAALLKNLFEPGLDLRLAFGRVRDDVLKSTRNRQEPFVYGSLGGTNIALVSAPAKPALAVDSSGERRDYELVEKIGTKGAWNVFITQHPAGFYADLARQQLDKLASVEEGDTPTATRKPGAGQKLGALEPNRLPSPPSPTSEEQRAWDRIKDSSDAAKFLDFIKRYPSSVLANTARTRAEALERAAREREEQARAEREAKATEAARQKAEREEQARVEREAKAAEAARQKAEREEQARAERGAKAAEAARQKAEREAALKRADEERLAKLAEAARAKQEAAAEAARRNAALEEQQQAEREAKAAEAARQKAEREAALRRAEEERLAKLAEAARANQEAAAEAARQKAEREEQARVEREAKAAEAARQKAEREELARAEREAKAAEAARQKVEREAAVKSAEEGRLARLSETNRAQEEAACKREEDRLASLKSVRNQSKAREGLRRLEQELTCERLRQSVTAALEKLEQTTTAPERPSRREKARHEEEKPRPVARQKEEKPRQRDEKPRQAARPQVRQEASSARPRLGGGGGGGGAMIGVGF
jgi:Caspase domain